MMPWRSMIQRMLVVLAFVVTVAQGAQTMPAKPPRFFNDYTGRVDRGMADSLNERLAQYERESSNQLLVAMYPRMQTNSSLEDYCTRTFESWGVGRADRDNGAVLFVFIEDRKMRIQTGYGLEATLTDAESFRIIEGMKSFFRAGDYAGGASFAVTAMIEATKGEYRGTGKTPAERASNALNDLETVLMIGLLLFIIGMIVIMVLQARNPIYVYDSKRRYQLPGERWWNTVYWKSGGGGGWSSSGSSSRSGGGSSWSGGGGSTGGGGASGSW